MLTTFWSWWVIVLTVTNLVLVTWLLFANKKVAVSDDDEPENQTTGHVYDGIEEYDNPLPKWWFQMFVLTLLFAVAYLFLYPGLGNYKGYLNWTSINQWEREVEKTQVQYAKTFGQYADMKIEDLARDTKAMKIGTRLFANNCAVCHGADGGGNEGFPNLTDKDWLWGGSPAAIEQSITHGRTGMMPPQGKAYGGNLEEAQVVAVAEYVMSLSGLEHDTSKVAAGEEVFNQVCFVCHQPGGKGMVGLAPNLSDDIWLYSASAEKIRHTIRTGRSNVMPAQIEKLRAEKIRMLTAYVYSLSLED